MTSWPLPEGPAAAAAAVLASAISASGWGSFSPATLGKLLALMPVTGPLRAISFSSAVLVVAVFLGFAGVAFGVAAGAVAAGFMSILLWSCAALALSGGPGT